MKVTESVSYLFSTRSYIYEKIKTLTLQMTSGKITDSCFEKERPEHPENVVHCSKNDKYLSLYDVRFTQMKISCWCNVEKYMFAISRYISTGTSS
jgi:hypothetical protein